MSKVEKKLSAISEPAGPRNAIVMRLLTPQEIDVVAGAGHTQAPGSSYTQGPGTNYTQGPGTTYNQTGGGGGGHEN